MGRIPYHRLPSRVVDAPALDKSAERALKALDTDLVVFFSRHYIMPDCTVVRDHKGEPGDWPRWHVALWSDRDNRFYKILSLQDQNFSYIPFDHRTVNHLRSDIVRVKGMKEAINHRARMREEEAEVKRKKLAAARADWTSDNISKIGEVMNNPTDRVTMTRDSKIFGFAGQTNRGTSHDSIEKSAKELGYNNEALESI